MKSLINHLHLFLLIIVLSTSFILRTYNTNWDSGAHLHPDERAIVMFALPIAFPDSLNEFLSPRSPLNPNFFAYGNLPLYILKLTSAVAANVDSNFATYEQINLLGRFIAAVVDTFTVLLIYKVGTFVFRKEIGLIASFIYGFSVFPIQTSHFFTADTLLTFFILLTLYRILKFYKNPTFLNTILIGATFGLSLATKISSLPLLFPLFIAIFGSFFFHLLKKPKITKSFLKSITDPVKKASVTLIATLLTFSIVQPYAFIDFKNFIEQNMLQSQMTHNPYIFPYTLQYVGKIPILYELKNIFLWGQGIFLASLCFGGVLFIIWYFKTYKKITQHLIVILFSFLILFFLIVANFAVGWMRYLLPIYPLLSIAGGVLTFFIFKSLKRFGRKVIVPSLILFVFLGAIWSFSFFSIYNKVHPRIAATNWINENIPDGSVIAVEHWDDRLPIFQENQYFFEELPLYEVPDDNKKWEIISSKISRSNYIILASNRLYTPLQKLGDCQKYEKCYPKTQQYYEDLFNGKLGFEKIAEFYSYPTVPLINLEINDQGADESFTVYDHPKVIIFKNTRL